MPDVYLLLGSNLGDKMKFLIDAEAGIKNETGNLVNKSSVYITEPWGFKHKEDFYNQVLQIQTNFNALEVLSSILAIETQLGRKRVKGGYKARTIDIDILFYGNEIIHLENLIVPHPQMHLRKFTLEPLCEIAPDLIHPILNKSISQLLTECTDNSQVQRL